MIHTTLVLLGSGEFTDNANGIDKEIFEIVKNKPVIAILPTAAGEEPTCWTWVEQGIQHFKALNIEAFGISVLTKADANNPKIVKEIEKANVIYFSGGNPGYLLDVLKESLLWKQISAMYNNGTVIASSSAGAMVMGKYVLSNPYQLEDPKEKAQWKDGFMMTEFSIIPHYDYIIKNDTKLYKKVLDQTSDNIMKTVIGIDENTGVFVIDGKLTKKVGLGEVHLIETGENYKF